MAIIVRGIGRNFMVTAGPNVVASAAGGLTSTSHPDCLGLIFGGEGPGDVRIFKGKRI